MSSRAGTFKRDLRPTVVAVVAVGLVLALIGGTLASLSSGGATNEGDDAGGERAEVEETFEVLAPDTASPELNAAIGELLERERFRFELVMTRRGSKKAGWRVRGEVDLATTPTDAPRLHAQIAVGGGSTYTVIADQIRIGNEVFTLDPASDRYETSSEGTGDGVIDADPVSSLLESVTGSSEVSFRYRATSEAGVVTARSPEGRARTRITIDRVSGAIARVTLVTRNLASELRLTDLGDPAIRIARPAL